MSADYKLILKAEPWLSLNHTWIHNEITMPAHTSKRNLISSAL